MDRAYFWLERLVKDVDENQDVFQDFIDNIPEEILLAEEVKINFIQRQLFSHIIL